MFRLQNRIAESTITLPFVGIVALSVWWVTGEGNFLQHLWCAGICALTTYILLETVAQHRLLRIRSRMITVLFVAMLTAFGFLHTNLMGCLSMLVLTAAFASVFNTYETPESPVQTLHTYLFLGLLAAICPPCLTLVPVAILCQISFQRSLSWRNCKAALLGVCVCIIFHYNYLGEFFCGIFPSINIEAWMLFWDNFLPLNGHIPSHPAELLALIFVILMFITGVVHYLRKNYDDNIEVRMHYYTLLVFQSVLLVMLILMPQHLDILLPLLMLCCAPAAGHFFSLTHTWTTNAWFILCTLFLISIGLMCNHPILFAYLSETPWQVAIPQIQWTSPTELFESWGYWGMLVASFIAGSVFPFSSEAVLTALILTNMDPMRLFIYATIGNIAGSMFNYWIGTFGKMEWIEKYLHVAPEKVDKTKRWMTRYGAWIGVLCFLPVLGSVIAVTLGFTRANPFKSFIAISIGKAARYAILVQIVASLV